MTPERVGRADAAPGDDDDRGEDVIEIDEWLLTFATLFREHLGEAGATEGPLDLRAVGLEKRTEALEEAVGTEKAKALLASAAEKFQGGGGGHLQLGQRARVRFAEAGGHLGALFG